MEAAYRAHVKYCMRTRFLSLRPPCLPLHPLYTTRRVGYIPPNPQGDTVLRTAPAVARYRLEEAFVPVSASVSALIFPCGEREKRLQYSGYLKTDTYCIRRAVPSAKSPDVRRAHGPHRAIVEGSALPLHPFTEEVVVPAIGHQGGCMVPSPVGYRRPCRMAVPFHRPQTLIRALRTVLPIPGGMLSVPVESECMPHSGSFIAHGVWESPPYKRERGPVVRTLQVKAWGTATWACPCMTRMGGLLPPPPSV